MCADISDQFFNFFFFYVDILKQNNDLLKNTPEKFTSRTRAMIPAAIGEEAEVPVWLAVQPPCRSVVTTFLSPCLNKSMEFELF